MPYMYCERIPTGVRKTTIPNPGTWTKNNSYYLGPVGQYHNWAKQLNNFNALQAALEAVGSELEWVGVSTIEGDSGYPNYTPRDLVTFVSVSKCEKYEGMSAGGGQNRVYVDGKMLKLTEFLAMDPADRRDLFVNLKQVLVAYKNEMDA